MKLLFCPECYDMFVLRVNDLRRCDCGKVAGQYINNTYAEVNGEGVSIAIGNGALLNAMVAAKTLEKTGKARYEDYLEKAHVTYCWVRPHEGEGNHHTKVNKDLQESIMKDGEIEHIRSIL